MRRNQPYVWTKLETVGAWLKWAETKQGQDCLKGTTICLHLALWYAFEAGRKSAEKAKGGK